MTCLSLSFVEPRIAILQIDTPGKRVNLVTPALLAELGVVLDRLVDQGDLTGLILASAKPGGFLAGADVRALQALLGREPAAVRTELESGRQVLERLAHVPFVTVAAVEGGCLGGGAELACWCDRRVLSDSPPTEIGFPEVKLGLIPGWGGTARLPRLVGLSQAVEMVTMGEPIEAARALPLGLADEVVPAEQLRQAAIARIHAEQQHPEYLADRRRLQAPLTLSPAEIDFLAETASRAVASRRLSLEPAASVALQLLVSSAPVDLAAACRLEADTFLSLLGSPANVGRMHAFFLREHSRRDSLVTRPATAPGLRTIGVVGAGIMGVGVAAANVRHGLPVILSDADHDVLSRAPAAVADEAAYDPRKHAADPARAAALARKIQLAAALEDLAGCDLVVEAVVENAEVKRRIFERLEARLAPTAVLASNTSTILISKLAQTLRHPERFCGLHFFNPVKRMRLVEVVRGERTSEATVAAAVAHVRRIGKIPIVVADSPGFLVNRLLSPYMNESLQLLVEGAEITAIDAAAESFGMPIGPIALYDLIGIDTAFFAGRVMWEAFRDRIAVSPGLMALYKAGRLGLKTGGGFYRYPESGGRWEPDPGVQDLLAPYVRQQRRFTAEELTDRLFLPMLLEATRVLQSGIVRDVRDVDVGLIFGLGFPESRGGLLFWADTLGARRIVDMLQPYQGLGKRFEPTPLLLEMARSGRKFYDAVPPPAAAGAGASA